MPSERRDRIRGTGRFGWRRRGALAPSRRGGVRTQDRFIIYTSGTHNGLPGVRARIRNAMSLCSIALEIETLEVGEGRGTCTSRSRTCSRRSRARRLPGRRRHRHDGGDTKHIIPELMEADSTISRPFREFSRSSTRWRWHRSHQGRRIVHVVALGVQVRGLGSARRGRCRRDARAVQRADEQIFSTVRRCSAAACARRSPEPR